MEYIFSNPIILTSWAGVTAMFIWFILKPLSEHFIKKSKNGRGYAVHDLQNQVKMLETNHLSHIQEDVTAIRKEISEFKKTYYIQSQDLRDRVLIIETNLKKNL